MRTANKVLVVTYYIPPRPGIASQRLNGLAKYLPEFGWEPIVFTAKLPDKPSELYRVIETSYRGDVPEFLRTLLGFKVDTSIKEQINLPSILDEKNNQLARKALNMVRAVVSFPDSQVTWLVPAIREGVRLLEKESFDAIISSSGPVTCHIIARTLKKRFRVPWVADFRDLWTQNHYYQFGRIRKFFEKGLEIRTIKEADVLVTVSEPLAELLGTLHRGKQVFSIPNGYDPEEVAVKTPTKEFTITHTGILYDGKRDPSLLFRAIAELIDEGRIDRRDVKIRFFGCDEYPFEKEVEKLSLTDLVELHPHVPRNVALEKQRESQILLLLLWDHPDEGKIYTGKLFEYLAAKRPILSLCGPKGIISELLEETKAGVHVAELEQLKRVLSGFYDEYKRYGFVPFRGEDKKIEKYSHRKMAESFAKILDSLKQPGR